MNLPHGRDPGLFDGVLPGQEESRKLAENLLVTARQTGDSRALAAALADLGALALKEKKLHVAKPLLEEALAAVQKLGDRIAESDILSNLGSAALDGGDPRQALELYEQALNSARSVDNRFAAKIALERLGVAYLRLGDPARALLLLAEAISLANETGDRKHKANLLWYSAIALADQGNREAAIANARTAIEAHEAMNSPEATFYKDHLEKYCASDSAAAAPGGNTIVIGIAGNQAGPAFAATPPARPVQFLRQAVSAAKAAAKFLGTGMKTVSPTTRAQRLTTCAGCEHHSGVRCRLCGCFTSAKTWLPHEACPIGKWERET